VAVEGLHRLFNCTTYSLIKSPHSEKEAPYCDVNLLVQDTTSAACKYPNIVKTFALIICTNNYTLYFNFSAVHARQ
jgi:hypothetical protein